MVPGPGRTGGAWPHHPTRWQGLRVRHLQRLQIIPRWLAHSVKMSNSAYLKIISSFHWQIIFDNLPYTRPSAQRPFLQGSH